MALSDFHAATREWFVGAFGEPSEPQALGWPAIARGGDALIAAPTGSGKTLAAFLWSLDALVREGIERELPDETRVVYVSPLKALGNDVERNLALPLRGIAQVLAARGLGPVAIRTAVRSGDTPATERAALARRPAHVLVTTPESLFILLTSESGRRALATTRTIIVDEIHALVGSKRGSHLALSIERLEALAGRRIARIGLSATQRPIEEVMRFLVGSDPERQGAATIVDCGLGRRMELALELPRSPLEPVMATEVWEEVYDRVAALASERRTTLVFVNTRRQCERVARNLASRLGEAKVGAHHGSMSREHRLQAERRLERGELTLLVATASLELGIDIGEVELVCQLGSTRAISALVQRVGRSGHFRGGVPRGRLFPQSRDDLVECVALTRAVEARTLDRIEVPASPLDILAQQVVAMAAAEPWDADTLFALVRKAFPYRALERDTFDAVVRMLADGYATARGRRGALIHHDRVNGRIRGRRGARLAAITGGGAIPDTADYAVVLEPSGVTVGTLNEDFAIESMAGDVFQLGNSSYRILRVASGTVRVEDAKGAPPSIPFWLGEAPARSEELSHEVSALREEAETFLREAGDDLEGAIGALARHFVERGLPEPAAGELAHYLGTAFGALGALPTRKRIVVERFFDESGGMQLVLHSPFGGKVNRAWGLALRKRFCRSFDFELQAAATEDAIVLSLGPTHSFPLEELRAFLRPQSVREVLVQALLLAPMFETRWRWNAGRSLAVPRMRGGSKLSAGLRRMLAADLLTVAFPDQQACAENLRGDREIPDHPLVRQTIDDCLHEAMDVERLEALLGALERGEVAIHFRELTEPSPLAQEILNARPYAFLDDAPLEERRTQAVMSRRFLDPETARSLGALDAAAIERVRAEAWPEPANEDELCDALVLCGFMTEREAKHATGQAAWLDQLVSDRRAARLRLSDMASLWVAAERVRELCALHPHAHLEPPIDPIPAEAGTAESRSFDEAAIAITRGRLEALGPVTAARLADDAGLPEHAFEPALHALEAEGFVLRGRFTPGESALEWCERGLLARIHRATLEKLRREIEPVAGADFVRFLFEHQHVVAREPLHGPGGLASALEQLAGYVAPAVSWEADLLPARVAGYDPEWLDELCRSGAVAWAGAPRAGAARTPDEGAGAERAARMTRATPITLALRDVEGALVPPASEPALSHAAMRVRAVLGERGASFFHDLVAASGLLPSQAETALGELASLGLVHADAYAGLRTLLTPERHRVARAGGRRPARIADPMARAGRWSLLHPAPSTEDAGAALEARARILLTRWGVVFRKLLEREPGAPPWRELVRVFRRMEARGEVRGGRFVDGFTGEQFASPEAVDALRRVRKREPGGELVTLGAADPLCLLGIVLPGERVVARAQHRVLFRDGVALAVLEHGRVRHLAEVDAPGRWDAELALRKRDLPAGVRAYV